ncbi:MAG: helix-turn-helix transcriptional regulator [Flavobacteriales bacterium]|nr:helix-turn-helix transcriptional regulator [Flavobacteriales bacterium]
MATAPQPHPQLLRLLQRLLRESARLHDLIETIHRALQPSPDTASPDTVPELTPTEERVLLAIVNSNDKFSAIWSDLRMGKRTFEGHLNNLYEKFGVRKRSSLVREAVRRGAV